MYQFVPNFILERYTAGETHGTFQAAGLFADLSGFSSMTDALMGRGQHGAEVLAGVMREAFTPLIHSVYEHGGFIATQAGDAFTALFPLDDNHMRLLHALAAAVSVQERALARPSYSTQYGDFPISIKVGLALGEVSWGIVSSLDGRRAAYYFKGSAVDGSAAAEHHAQPGEVILDPLAYQQAQGVVTAESAGDYFRLRSIEVALPASLPVELPQQDVDLVSRFIPREVISRPVGGEFRQVTHLFVNLPTVRTEEQLAIFLQTLFELQDRYGGLFNRLDFGDKGSNLLLFWGALSAYENDVERCLNMVLDLQTQTSIPISAGVTHQLAHAGYIGSELSGEFTCFGRGVNLAARFMSAAPRGEIWLDEGTARKAVSRFELEFIGDETFKGFSVKQKVYLLLERKREIETIFSGPLVGREAEINRLAEFIQPVFNGQCAGVMLIGGEPGIGKSRLVFEFQKSTVFSGRPEVAWILCQTDEILRQSLNPFSYWLKRYYQQSPEQSDSRNKRNFNRKLDDLIDASKDDELTAELDRTRSFLGALLDLRWPDSLYEQLDAQGRHENTFIAVTAVLKAMSCRQPLVIFIEDAHWMDADSKSFLQYLLRALAAKEHRSYPIAILATARYEGEGLPFDDALAAQEINLGVLRNEDLAQMVEALLGSKGSAQLVGLLAHHAEGNPFFAEQILRYLQESGLLEEGATGWMVREQDLERTPLPADVHALLVARLDRLTWEVREVVQTAAVFGREFEVKVLAAILHDDASLSHKIKQAERAAIWTALNQLRYIFKHALLRDAAYQMQLRARREQLHRLAAGALEKVYADELPYHCGELAYHCEKGGLEEKARRYLQLAGDAARDAYQNDLAADYYSRAINLTPEDDLEARYRLFLARQAIYNLQGKRDEQSQDLDVLRSLALALEDIDKQIEVEVERAIYLKIIGDYREAFVKAEGAIGLAEGNRASDSAIGAYYAACEPLYKQGDYETAIQYGQKGLALAAQSGDRSMEAQFLNVLGMIFLELQDLPAAKTCFEQSIDIFQEISQMRNQAMPLNNLGMLSGFLGDYTASQDYYKRSLAIAQEIGHRTGEGLVLGNLGWVTGILGDFAIARSYAEQAIKTGREVGSRLSELYGLLNLSLWTRLSGEPQTSIKCAEQALDIARQSHDRNGEAYSLTYLGHSLLALGRSTEAAAAYQAALDMRSAMDQPALAAEAGAGLARLALDRGDLSAARAHITPILAHLDRGGSLDGTDEPLNVYLTFYLVLQANNERRAASILEKAHQILLERAGKIKDEQNRQSYLNNFPYHRQILQARERLQDKAMLPGESLQ